MGNIVKLFKPMVHRAPLNVLGDFFKPSNGESHEEIWCNFFGVISGVVV